MIGSHYRILDKLGGGGMGVVREAEDLKLGRHVPLKFFCQKSYQDSLLGNASKGKPLFPQSPKMRRIVFETFFVLGRP